MSFGPSLGVAPTDYVEVINIKGAGNIVGALVADIPDANKPDIGRYQFIILMVLCAGITASVGAPITFTPIFSNIKAGAGTRLDGTNGQPDKRIIINDNTAFDNTAVTRSIRTDFAPGQWFNLEIDVAAGSTFAGQIVALGVLRRIPTHISLEGTNVFHTTLA